MEELEKLEEMIDLQQEKLTKMTLERINKGAHLTDKELLKENDKLTKLIIDKNMLQAKLGFALS